MNIEQCDDAWWKEKLRMSQDVCRELKLHIEKQTTYMKMPVSSKEAVTLWRLAPNAKY